MAATRPHRKSGRVAGTRQSHASDAEFTRLRKFVRRGRYGKAAELATRLISEVRSTRQLAILGRYLLDRRDLAGVDMLLASVSQTGLAASPAYALSETRLAAARHDPGASDLSDRARLKYPHNAEIQLLHLSLLLREGRKAEALTHGKDLAAQLTKPRAILGLAELLHANGEAAAARMALSRNDGALKKPARLYLLQAEISQALNDDNAIDWLAQGCRAFPGHARLHSAHWTALARAGQRDAAISACLAFIPSGMTKSATHLARAKFLHLINASQAFEAEITQARAGADGKDIIAIDVLIARTLFAAGDAAASAEILHDLPKHAVETPKIGVLLARLDAAQGEVQGAITRLKTHTNYPDAQLLMARLCCDIGAFEAALAALATLPDRLTAKRAVLEIRILKETGDHAGGAARAEQAAREHGGTHPAIWHVLSDMQAINGQIDAAWQSHRHRIALARSTDVIGQNSIKARQSFWGQILNEYRLMSSPEDRAYRAPGAAARPALRHFRRRVADEPDNIAAAMGLVTILRRMGAIPANAPQSARPGAEKIPRRIIQFWDAADPEPEIAALCAHNKSINSGWEYQLYNNETARQFLHDHGEGDALAAYSEASLAAAKADIFRLACLYHKGGVYLDADDKCLTRLDNLLDRRLTFTACQEDLTSIGNNFIACAPKHPILSHALKIAGATRNNTTGESVWLALGPGLLTRAIAAAGTTREGTLRQGIWIMPAYRLNQHVKTAMPLGYKSTAAHWVRELAARR